MFCVHYFAFASKGQILRNVFPSSSLDLICKYVTKSFSWPLRRFRIIIKQKRDVEGLRDLQSIRIQEHRWKFEFVFLVSGKLDLVSLRDACCQARVRELVTHWWGRIFSKKPRELRGAGQATRNLIYTMISVVYILSRRFLRQSTNVLSVTQFVKWALVHVPLVCIESAPWWMAHRRWRPKHCLTIEKKAVFYV